MHPIKLGKANRTGASMSSADFGQVEHLHRSSAWEGACCHGAGFPVNVTV
jgi:hypothetical protein